MKFNNETLSYLQSMSGQAKAISAALGSSGVTAQAILGAVGEEYQSLNLIDTLQTFNVSRETHQSIADNFKKVAPDEVLKQKMVTGNSLEKLGYKLTNPVLNDIGPGNIKILTAIELLQNYSARNINTDPLGIKIYSSDYHKLVSDLSDKNNPASLKFAALMLQEANEFYQDEAAAAWNTYNQDTKDAVLVTYYNNGYENSVKKIDGRPVGTDYFPKPGGGVSGGEVFLENIVELKQLVGVTHVPPATGNNAFALNIDNLGGFGEKSSTDHDRAAADVAAGLVAGGGGWAIKYDDNKLNLNQYQNGWIDNTFQAAATQILADSYRPGNTNTVKEVFDFSLRSASDGLSFGNTANQFGAFINSGNAQARLTLPTDPLVLDLNGDGVRLTDYGSAPVLFDIDNDGGSLEETGWVSSADGIVVVDRNNNGRIDNISETLSEYFGGAAGTGGNAGNKPFKDGFAALKSLDSNGDNVFDSRDAAWSTVKVWVDANHDGKSWIDSNNNNVMDAGEATELKTLAALGISRIDLANQAQNGETRDGNEVLARGSFVQNGVAKEAIAANFLANPNGHTFTTQGNGTIVSTQGSGQVAPVKAYSSSSSTGETIDVAQKSVNNATGGNGNDVLIGDAGTNWLAGGRGSDSFRAGAGDDVLLIDAQDQQANINAGAGTDIVQVIGDQGVTLNLALAEVEIAQGGRGNDVFVAGGQSTVFMRGGDGDDILVGGGANDALSGENGGDLVLGGGGNDVLRGHRGRDQMQGDAGNDLIDGGLDDDTLSGGLGDDVLIGGGGDDSIDGGEGLDVIQLSGDFADYRITRTTEGIWISDTVAGRDGTDFVRNVEKANFKNVVLVDIPSATSVGLEAPMLVNDVLTKDKSGVVFGRGAAHLIGKDQLLQNDIDWQGDALRITGLFDVTGGTASVTAAGDVLFTPDANFTGVMGFKYTVADAKGNAAASVIDMGTGESATMRAAVYLRTPELPNDPLLTDQWYLSEANILPVWRDYTGKGVRIGMFETNGAFGTTKEILDYRHADLKSNIDPLWLANATPGQRAGEGSDEKFSDHATLVAGVMVASRNGEGSVGVAYDAKLAGYWLNKDDFSALDHIREYDVVNNSWGSSSRFDLRFLPTDIGVMPSSYLDALKYGRDGLGTVIVTAAGNDRQQGGNANYSNVSNSSSSIIVGAINAATDLGAMQFGGKPFSSPGASILVSAPGSNVTSTSRLVQNDNGSTFGADTTASRGTSFATPIVSGIVALMLEANPLLGYRDVQQILALSAKKVNDPTTVWQNNGSKNWNGGGMHVSHDYGYGEVDARAAVRLAETWNTQQTIHNEKSLAATLSSGTVNKAIADGQAAGLKYSLSTTTDILVEHVEIRIGLTHARPGDLIIKLISPSGTESILMDRPGKAPGSAANVRGDSTFNGSNTLDYVFDTARLRGESSKGTWTLQVIDTATGDVGTLNHWSMNVRGLGDTLNDQYVYTNEYAQLAATSGRNVLNDTDGGVDTINAAAISQASRIDLSKGEATLAGARLTIQNPTQIEGAIGGEFADELIGNAANNQLVGGRGNDVLSGGAGSDLLIGGLGNDTLSGGVDLDYFVINKEAGAAETLLDFSPTADKLVLSGFNAAAHASLKLIQDGADTLLNLPDGQLVRFKNVQAGQLKINDFVYVEQGVTLAELRQYALYSFGSVESATERILPNDGITFWTNAGGERVFGGNGNDAIYGGPGNDVLVGENSTTGTVGGNDIIDGGAGSDVVRGGAGNDVLRGGSGQDYLGGDAGDDTLYLEGDQGALDYATATLLSPTINVAGTATLTGASVAGGAGNDRFVIVEDRQTTASQGLLGNLIDDFEAANPKEKIDLTDISTVSAFSDLKFSSLTVNGTQYLRVWLGAMVSGTQYITLKGVTADRLSAANFIFGEPSPQVLVSGTSGNDVLVGDAGGNTLDGGAGADVMEGRTGDDTYVVDNTGDVVKEVVGGGYDLVRSSVSHVLANEVEALELSGVQTINGTGNASANRLVGNAAANILDGGAGSDVMLGGLGNDTYVVDDSSDRVIEQAGEGTDTVRSSVSFTLATNLENLVLTGTGANNATGNAVANQLTGNAADNRLDGAQGADLMTGGAGNDTYLVDNAGDVIKENANEGFDKVISTVNLTLAANVESLELAGSAVAGTGNSLDNELIGNALNNKLSGGAGNDLLIGGAGNDSLTGGVGNDWMQGGVGDDRYLFAIGDGQDRIEESVASSGGVDTIVLGAGINETDVAVDHSADGMVLRLNNGQQITSGWTASAGHAIERIEFANGKVWETAALSTQANRAPTLSSAIPDQQVNEDSVFSYTLPTTVFKDADPGDALSLSAALTGGKALPAWLKFDAVTRTFSGTPDNSAVGNLSIVVTAKDKAGLTAADTFVLKVINLNDAPALAAPIPDQTATEDMGFSYTLPLATFKDIDAGDVLTLSATQADGKALPTWLKFDAATRTFSGTPDNAAVGALSILVTAKDKAGAAITDVFVINVNNVNDAPTLITAIPDQKATEDSLYQYTLPVMTFSDLDKGDVLTLSATLADGKALPSWLKFDAASRTFSGTPGNAEVGNLTLLVTAKDKAGISVADTFTLTVSNTNDAPVLAKTIADQSLQLGQTLTYSIPSGTFTDVDAGDRLTYTATLADGTALPTWLAFNPTTLSFTGKPTSSGSLSIKIVATDIAGKSVSDTFDISVAGNSASITGTEGADTLRGDAVANIIHGLGGNDTLYGGAGNDTLNGGSGSDWLYGDDGDDVLDGGAGDDRLSGDRGNDTYLLYRGMGSDTISEFDFTIGNLDTIKIATDLKPSDIEVSRDALSLYLSIKGTTDKLSVWGQFSTTGQIERVQFADGTVWDANTLDSMTRGKASEGADKLFGDDNANTLDGLGGDDSIYGLLGNDLLNGGNGNDSLSGGDGNDTLNGGAGNDNLYGDYGEDMLDGGLGNDYLSGGYGSDVYKLYRGMGQDSVSESGNVTDIDKIVVASGIAPTDIVLSRDAYDLFLSIKGTIDKLTITNFTNTYSQIERVEFTDGTAWSLDQIKQMTRGIASDAADTLFGEEVADSLDALGGDDKIYGLGGNDILRGGAGADELNGGTGNDTLDGGSGNDSLIGGGGNDTYIFARGYGQDQILDSDWTVGNIDTIKFSSGIIPSDIRVSRTDRGDLELIINGTTDKLTVSRWFFSTDYRIESIEFADGTRWDSEKISNLSKGTPTEGNDSLYGDERADTLGGLGGDDTLYGYAGNDTLNGGTGNDTLYGGDGTDILDGGAGNDYLAGEYGSDSYLFYRGAGQDRVQEYDNTAGNIDVVKIASDLKPTDIQLSRSASDLYLSIQGTTDKLTVSNWFYDAANRVEQVQFSNGITWDTSAIFAMTKGVASESNDTLFGGEGTAADTLNGLSGNDVLYGLAGNDILFGGNGQDTLYGADGLDTLNGGAGNDLLDGGVGNDLYRFGRGAGQDRIQDFDTQISNQDVLQLEAGITKEQLWFSKNGSDLEVSIIGTTDKITIENWSFWSKGSSWEKAQHIEQIRTADGKTLHSSNVDQLVEKMATLAPPPDGQTDLSQEYWNALSTTIANNWL